MTRTRKIDAERYYQEFADKEVGICFLIKDKKQFNLELDDVLAINETKKEQKSKWILL